MVDAFVRLPGIRSVIAIFFEFISRTQFPSWRELQSYGIHGVGIQPHNARAGGGASTEY